MDYRDNRKNTASHHPRWAAFTPPRWSNFAPPLTKRLTARGELPHVRVGRSMRFVMEDLLAYVASQRRRSGG